MENLFLSKEDIEEIKKYVTFKPVLNFNFSTNMLFRCTVKKYAEDFKSGKIRFNQPKYWIEAERQGNKGLGDELEGIFLITSKDDKSKYITQLKNDNNYDYFIKNNKLFF